MVKSFFQASFEGMHIAFHLSSAWRCLQPLLCTPTCHEQHFYNEHCVCCRAILWLPQAWPVCPKPHSMMAMQCNAMQHLKSPRNLHLCALLVLQSPMTPMWRMDSACGGRVVLCSLDRLPRM